MVIPASLDHADIHAICCIWKILKYYTQMTSQTPHPRTSPPLTGLRLTSALNTGTAFGANSNNGPFGGGGGGGATGFGGATSSGSGLFGAANTNTGASTGFGGFGNSNSSSTLFGGGSKPGFGTQTTGSLFGGGGGGGGGNAFGSNTGTSPFGAPALASNSADCQGTGGTPFSAFQEKDGGAASQTNYFQSITCMAPYKNFSFEVSQRPRI